MKNKEFHIQLAIQKSYQITSNKHKKITQTNFYKRMVKDFWNSTTSKRDETIKLKKTGMQVFFSRKDKQKAYNLKHQKNFV